LLRLFYIAFLLYLGGCAQGGSGSDSSGISIQRTGVGTAPVSWTPPTENTDGSALTDLAGYKVYFGTSPGGYGETITVNNPGLSSYLVGNLPVSDWYFVVTAFNSSGIESAYSTEAYIAIN
jgi:hypothetical protein